MKPDDANVRLAYKARTYALLPAAADPILDLGCGTGDDVLAIAEEASADTYVVGPGHTPAVTAGSSVVEFSRTAELGPVMEVVGRNVESILGVSL